MSIKALSDYTFYSRYARYNKEEKRRETWEEAVGRVFQMHRTKYAKQIEENLELEEYISFAQEMQNKKRVLAAQRSLQFAGDPIFKHELKMFNCLFSHIDRIRVFQETMYSLLCGCGVGFSVQKQHVKQIGNLHPHVNPAKTYVVEDSIEGWADAVGVLMNSYFATPNEFFKYQYSDIDFDLSQIRPEGALIAGQFKAPGPNGLKVALEKITKVIETRLASPSFKEGEFANKLRPIDCYDIIMHVSDAVLSGGVRRSATLCLFSHDDGEMMTAKTGDWFTSNPQRARSNNSAALLKGKTTREEFALLIKSTKEFGEPAFIWLDDLDIGYNPCVEIGLYPKTRSGKSGFQGCNLTEINGKKCDTKENFFKACKASAVIGTLQAGYTNFKYLTKESGEIFAEEALLGCSITGMMDNPELIFDPEVQKEAAELILKVNEEVAKMIGINPTARATCVKPAGSTSCVLGTASGIHPHHAKRYIRRVQANKSEFCLSVTESFNPSAVEESVWSANKTDKVISFLCEVPQGAIVKNQLKAVDLLEKVRLTQMNWVKYGKREDRCVNPKTSHNVSNTITVKPEEWDDVEKFIFDNQTWFAGISLLPASGDLDYAQAPFSTVLTPNELVREYGDASVFASGLIVEALRVFDGNLWDACSSLLFKIEHPNLIGKICYQDWFDLRRRMVQFADRYFAGDLQRMTYCLKHVSLWKTWCDLKRDYKDIDWSTIIEDSEVYIEADTLGAQACSGGQCDVQW
jgi:ribonucleoside-triphosphate reductase (thioredoxin)